MWKTKLIRDRKYLNSYRGAACYLCNAYDGTVVGAHIRWGHTAGLGLKNDQYMVPLCHRCHLGHPDGQEANPGPDWWASMAKNMAKRAYWGWKAGAGR